MKIMIVEDEIISALALTHDLQRHGYTVCQLITSGLKAVEQVEAERPDVVFMDIRLQGPIDGLEAAQRINLRFGIPIVFLTGHLTETLVEQLKEVDHIGFLAKPVRAGEVIKLLQGFFPDS